MNSTDPNEIPAELIAEWENEAAKRFPGNQWEWLWSAKGEGWIQGRKDQYLRDREEYAALNATIRELDALRVPDKWEINRILFEALKDEKLAGELTYKIAALHSSDKKDIPNQ